MLQSSSRRRAGAAATFVQPLGNAGVDVPMLVYRDGRQNVPKIKAFRDWVLAEVERDRTNKERTPPRLAIM